MARNVHTSHVVRSSADAQQYELPWSPTGQAPVPPARTDGRDGVALPVEGSAQADLRVCDSASPDALLTPPEAAPVTPERQRERRPPLSLRARVERLLRDRHIPYVDVDEAKRALFASAKLRAFHFVAYRKHGPNWLIFAAKADRRARENMAEWEQVFGDGFIAVLASPVIGEGIRFRSLDGRAFSLDEPAGTEGESSHVQGGGSC